MILDAKGNVYGTTTGGGPSNNGVVFELDPLGHETVLYSFTGGADGGVPYAGLVRDAGGNLYGTTVLGGASRGAGFVDVRLIDHMIVTGTGFLSFAERGLI